MYYDLLRIFCYSDAVELWALNNKAHTEHKLAQNY